MQNPTQNQNNNQQSNRNDRQRGGQQRGQRPQRPQEEREFEEKVIQVSRVSKKTKGGNQMGFSIVVVVGDKQGRVGVGLGKAADVVTAIRKGVKKAKKKMVLIPMNGTTIPFRVDVKFGAGRVMLKPAPRGSGVIAGGPVRAVVEAAGIRDISSKIMGSDNQASSVYATFAALKKIQQMVTVKGIKLKSVSDVEKEEKLKEKETAREDQAKAQVKQENEKEKAEAVKAAKPKAAKAPVKVAKKTK